MNEELMEKLVESLKSRGMSDEEIEKVKLEITEEPEKKEEPEKPEEKKEETPSNESPVTEGEVKPEESGETKPVESGEPKEEKPVEESPEVKPEEQPVPPVNPEEQPKDEDIKDEKLPENIKEVDPENPVVEEPTNEPKSPGYEALINELKTELEEEKKARLGLEARLESAMKALEESGVIGVQKEPASKIGVHDPTRVDDYHEDEITMESVLNEVNKR